MKSNNLFIALRRGSERKNTRAAAHMNISAYLHACHAFLSPHFACFTATWRFFSIYFL